MKPSSVTDSAYPNIQANLKPSACHAQPSPNPATGNITGLGLRLFAVGFKVFGFMFFRVLGLEQSPVKPGRRLENTNISGLKPMQLQETRS